MKKSLLLFSLLLTLPVTLIGCATTSELEKVQADQKLLDAKVEQALQDAQAAKVKADETSLRADEAIKAAEAREKAADEKAQKADAAFQKSMRK